VVRKTDINDRLVRFAWWTLAIIVFGLVLAIRIRLLGIPLERDEGEYAYAGQLTLQGIPPYKLAYSMKFPGTFTKCAPAKINVGLISSPMRCHLVGSYRMEQTKNEGLVAQEMGNSPKVVKDHYFEIVDERAAREYWSIKPLPKHDRKIVAFR
jgi:hypothetical protein